ncbi:MAG: lysophospholipid acyltransferase family protein [Rhodospirillaceae bacterium]|nr:lysophospholipid acyltransferase family protein [Rhodospirillaceae bacterium]MBT4687810.1 lysophospholipid acyltransferase family protein [Rhodospirillaceae bacterium]MBT5082384.1 lysophospholipid acyltransferase family protein [Rhodospirillaceae bacterium]MBT5524586.1 lysophospholipid acyltransferase family protein [Rhodospirillaceae bacterium]MBT5878547.1 lysophospholipid acyltransferase family protein [Rhodospirillaceae bacterium]
MGLGKRFFNTAFAQSMIGVLMAQYVRLVTVTTRWQVVDGHVLPDLLAQGHAVIAITWHGRLMMIPKAWPGPSPLHLLISRHGDGEMVARIMARFGMRMVRGSTQRQDRDRDKGGAVALRQMLTLLKAGHSVGVTPDGPRGPARYLSSGVITLARLSGAPVVPVIISTRWHHSFSSWDRFRLALPCSRGAIIYGAPVILDRKMNPAQEEAARRSLEAALDAAMERADRLLGDFAGAPDSKRGTAL